uniref:Ufd2P_core domain-containing protein n=1 Tax=Gongylonema pulchrum TaxID=637853 RepID=A0A183D1P4_9BILA
LLSSSPSFRITWLLADRGRSLLGRRHRRNAATIATHSIATTARATPTAAANSGRGQGAAKLDMTTQLTKLFSFILANVHDPSQTDDPGPFSRF